MLKKMMKKIISGTLALASVMACAGTFTACETAHPEFTMKISFNGETYEMDYYLYRKVAPATTEHFIWLVDSGYYNGLCVHDYNTTSNRMYTGGYVATDLEGDTDGLLPRNYYEFVEKHKDLASFPHSVWSDSKQQNSLYTLRGEFKSNSFEVESGALKPEFGSLTMYYHSNQATDDVYVEYESRDGVATRQYKYNSATSLFYIALSSSATVNSDFCTFALLQSGSKDDLEDLLEAIDAYIDSNYGENSEDSFTESHSVIVGENDKLLDDYETVVSYSVPQSKIVIESIEMTKY